MENSFQFGYSIDKTNYSIERNLPTTKDINFLRNEDYYLQRDMFALASSVFLFEKILKQNRMISEFRIPISNQSYETIDVDEIEKNINLLILGILHSDVKVKLLREEPKFTKTKKESEFSESNAVCLFSGGVDSYSGILNAKRYFEDVVPLFIAHSDQSGIINIVNKMNKDKLNEMGVYVRLLHAPPMSKGGYSQLRGFLYLMLAGLYSSVTGTNKIIITECGTTMYQPRFSPMDQITFTTHPKVLSTTKNILSAILGSIELIIPFENMTKAEVIAAAQDRNNFPMTHSCITQRNRSHDGTCYGCVIRKLGTLVANVEDVEYNYDVLSSDDSYIKSDNFVSLMNTCYDILFDYENLSYYTLENIETYGKQDLFIRFSSDNFAALFINHNILNNKISKFVLDLYNKAIEGLGVEYINKRIEEIRTNNEKPDFERKV